MLSLSKQHNKMLKNKFEMLKIRKNVKIIKLEKFSRENPEDSSSSNVFYFRTVNTIKEYDKSKEIYRGTGKGKRQQND